MKKLFAGIILSLAAFAAMAMPRPSDIENALAARDYQSAKSMTQEVLRAKPDSAKAHLFNAYVLLKADNNVGAAREELRLARMLDKDHKVQNSALFGRTAAELERVQELAQRNRAVKPRPAYTAPVVAPTYDAVPVAHPAPNSSGFWTFIKFLFWMTVLGAFIYLLYRMYKGPKTTCTGHTYDSSTYTAPERPTRSSSGFSAPYAAPERQRYDAPTHTVGGVPAERVVSGGSTTVVNNHSGDSGVGNLATGMMLGHMMSSHGSHHDHHHHDSHSHGHSYNNGEVVDSRFMNAPASYSAPVAATSDYETTRSSFSSGSNDNDSWTSSSSSASSIRDDDSWTSSSSSSSYSSRSSDDDWGSRSSSSSSYSSSDYSSSSSSDYSSSDSSSSSGGDW